MKVKKDFVARKVAGADIVVATGKAVKHFNGYITLNETGRFLFDLLGKETSVEELTEKLKARAGQYLAEGIDGDEDGEYAERSTGNYKKPISPNFSFHTLLYTRMQGRNIPSASPIKKKKCKKGAEHTPTSH